MKQAFADGGMDHRPRPERAGEVRDHRARWPKTGATARRPCRCCCWMGSRPTWCSKSLTTRSPGGTICAPGCVPRPFRASRFGRSPPRTISGINFSEAEPHLHPPDRFRRSTASGPRWSTTCCSPGASIDGAGGPSERAAARAERHRRQPGDRRQDRGAGADRARAPPLIRCGWESGVRSQETEWRRRRR